MSHLELIRAEQALRQRSIGVVIDTSTLAETSDKAKARAAAAAAATASEPVKTLEDITGQFASETGDTVSAVAHQKILDAYIEERMGHGKREE